MVLIASVIEDCSHLLTHLWQYSSGAISLYKLQSLVWLQQLGASVYGWVAGWLVGWLAGWLVGWVAGWLVGWLAG
jgi:hypothetical protein